MRPERVSLGGGELAGWSAKDGNERISSAVSKTAGITVEKQTDDPMKYGMSEMLSTPRYSQLRVRKFINSNIHQAGIETRNSRKNCGPQRVASESPRRHSTKPSIV